MYARHCRVGRSPTVGGMLYSSSQRGRDEGKRRGRESEKSESAKTGYRGMRAADAHRSSRIASGYPAIKPNDGTRGGGGYRRERESMENNYRRSDIHPGLYRVSGERLSTSRGCGDDITGKNPTFIIDVLVGAPCSTPSSIVAAYDGGALRQVASAIRDVCRLSTEWFPR